MRFLVIVSETGDAIEACDTMEEAKETLARFEAEDKEAGTYETDYYEIVRVVDVYEFGECEIDEYETETNEVEVPEEYEEVYVTKEGYVVGYDEAIAGYVRLA